MTSHQAHSDAAAASDLRLLLADAGLSSQEVEAWTKAVETAAAGASWPHRSVGNVALIRDFATWCRDLGLTPSSGIAWANYRGDGPPDWITPWVNAGYTATQTHQLLDHCPDGPFGAEALATAHWAVAWRESDIDPGWVLRYVRAGIKLPEAVRMELDRANGRDVGRELDVLAALRRRP